MANHLITNALLRPHGTNNPYNTLLGDSAVYNNPAVGMYNTQGVPGCFYYKRTTFDKLALNNLSSEFILHVYLILECLAVYLI